MCMNPTESFNYSSSFSLFEWSIHAVLANNIKETSSILCHTALYTTHAHLNGMQLYYVYSVLF